MENAYEKSKDFTFLRRLGEFRIKKLRAAIRQTTALLQKDPDNEAIKQQLQQLQDQMDSTELEHFRQCEEN